MRRLTHALLGILAALVVAAGLLWMADKSGFFHRTRIAEMEHVPEDASGPLEVIAIHYAPAADDVALEIWHQLFLVLPDSVKVEVAVAQAADFDRFMDKLRGWQIHAPERFVAVVIGKTITTWSRDRFAAMQGDGIGTVLAPPRIETTFGDRQGDWSSPFALADAVWGRPPRIADFVFEGGDLASTPRWLFADVNLAHRNLGRADATRERLITELGRHFRQEVIWLGDEVGDVPQHHMMMYAVPLDEHRVAVGDVHAGAKLLATEPAGQTLAVDPDLDGDARRFDHAAQLLADHGFKIVRFPVVVLAGGGSYVTYTNALFDRAPDGQRVVYLPTYRLPVLDHEAQRIYEEMGYLVHPIDVAPIYNLNGSLGCLVNVMKRGLTL